MERLIGFKEEAGCSGGLPSGLELPTSYRAGILAHFHHVQNFIRLLIKIPLQGLGECVQSHHWSHHITESSGNNNFMLNPELGPMEVTVSYGMGALPGLVDTTTSMQAKPGKAS